MNLQHAVDALRREISGGFLQTAILRLILAAVLGGLIGLERQFKRRSSGLRTFMFISVGSALFTLMSKYLAADPSDQTRIASQIIAGIGFIGAGTILHNRGLTTGLTTASTVFVVAAVGMASGGGFYLTATFATCCVLLLLFVLGLAEQTFNLKTQLFGYEVSGRDELEIVREVNRILEPDHRIMENIVVASTHDHTRLQFSVEGTNAEQTGLFLQLQTSKVLGAVTKLGPVEPD